LETVGEIAPLIVSDPTRLRQILTNIVGNALKFTENGSVTVRVEMRPASHLSVEMISFTVEDTGIGMTAEQSGRLFKNFMQADNTMTRRFGGTGLGLVLSKRLAHLMGGDIALLESEPNKGSVFQIQIATHHDEAGKIRLQSPFQARSKGEGLQGRAMQGPASLADRKVLVVEDSADNQLLIKNVLSEAGASVEFAKNGLEGVERALHGDFDVVLMDIQMPLMDGFEATSRLRQEHYKRPIIALTANAMSTERERYAEVGFDEYLMKPINMHDLVDKIAFYSATYKRHQTLELKQYVIL
jgi:CheY-like chemotaxis protein